MAIIEQGGTAADAAIAVAAMLSVVEPWFSSVLGGGTWALYYEASTGEVTSLDGVGPIGSNASVDDFAVRAAEAGMHQSVVPGAWDGWMLWLDRYGSMDLPELLAPAVAAAQAGVLVSGSMSAWLEREASLIADRPDTAAIYRPDGRLVRFGEVVRQEALAATLLALSEAYTSALPGGRTAAVQAARDYMYRGPLADAIVAMSDAGGGYFTKEDFASFEAAIVPSISVPYGDDLVVFQNPPNSQGITQLLALNILDGLDFTGLAADDALSVHYQVEALKLAFADRHYHVGDPARREVPVGALLSDDHADRQRARISADRVLAWPIEDVLAGGSSPVAPTLDATSRGFDPPYVPPTEVPTGTTTFHIVDRAGNAAAVTTSLGAQFYVMGDTGIHINNRMRFTALAEGDPNELTPGFKVRHTSNPYLVLRDGMPFILGGNTGADSQVQGQVQQFLHVVEFGATAQEAIDAPRFISTAFPATTYPYAVLGRLAVEVRSRGGLASELQALGHTVSYGPAIYGTAHMIVVNDQGIEVGAEPRLDTASGLVRR